MRIAYVSDYLPSLHKRAGGADWACWRIGNLVKGSGYDIVYYVLSADKDVQRPKDVNFVPVAERFLPPVLAKYSEVLKWYIFQFDALAFFYFLAAFSSRRPDIVHLHRFRFISFSALLAARMLKIPVYFSVYDYWMFCALETLTDEKGNACRKFHGVWCWRCLPKKFVWFQQALLLFRKRVFDLAIKSIGKYIVLSRSSAQILSDYGIEEKKISIIPLPYDENSFNIENEIVAGDGRILYVGWIQKRKGLDVLLRAMPKIRHSVPGVKLVVIGPDVKWEEDYRVLISSLIDKLDLKDSIEWLGARGNKEVQEQIRNSCLVVVPEQWENMCPVIVGEAMFNRRAAVGSDLGGIPDFISDGESGLLFRSDSPEDLADKVIYLLSNKEKLQRMGQRGFEFAHQRFSQPHILQRYKELYSS